MKKKKIHMQFFSNQIFYWYLGSVEFFNFDKLNENYNFFEIGLQSQSFGVISLILGTR